MTSGPGAIAAIFLSATGAWSLSIGAHELLGHGGVCAIDPACTWVSANAMYFHGRFDGVGMEFVWRAGGTLVNLVLGCLALWLLPRARNLLALFLWQVVAISFINQGAYVAWGWAIDPGMDWAMLVGMSPDTNLARLAVLVIGHGLIVIGLWSLWRLGTRLPGNWRQNVLVSFAAFSLTALAASALVPTDERLYMLMGGLGNGAFFMAPMLLLALATREDGEQIMRAPVFLAFLFFVTGAYLGLLGPEVTF